MRSTVIVLGAAALGVLLLGAIAVKASDDLMDFALGPSCSGDAGPVSVDQAQASLVERGFQVEVPERASECSGVAAAVVADKERHLTCILRPGPVYAEAFRRLPDTAGGLAHFVARNVECFVRADWDQDVAALELAARELAART